MNTGILGLRAGLAAALALSASVAAHAQVEISDPPADHHFGKIPLGATYAAQYYSVFNRGGGPVTLGAVGFDGQLATCAALGCPVVAPADFVVGGSDGCSNQTLQPGTGCSTLIGFVPTDVGTRLARLVVPVQGQESVTRTLTGVGVSNPSDCVFDWAERQFPDLLKPAAATVVIAPYYARCYQGNTLCVGIDAAVPTLTAATFAPPSVYLYQNQRLTRIDSLTNIAAQAQCR